jgi:hypothetical protein
MLKLISREDRFQLHKTLGLYCTLHYIYRYYNEIRYDDMLFKSDYTSLISVVPHFILPLTSFLFHVLSKRIITKPTMIWREMQLHSIVFTSRSIFVFLWKWLGIYETKWINLFIVLIHHLAADYVSKHYGDNENTTIRVNNKDSNIGFTLMKRFYSFMQFGATSALIIIDNTLTSSFGVLTGVHYAAFAMTLHRKNIISRKGYHIIYIVSLLFPIYLVIKYYSLIQVLAMILIFMLRIKFNINKYLLWLIFTLMI